MTDSARGVAIDHVLIVSRDPASTALELFERTGLAWIPGGEHDGLGTRNVIVPLGIGYLEIVEAHDESLARANPFGRLVLAGLAAAEAAGRNESLFAWSVAVDDASAVAAGLEVGMMSLSRAGVSVQLAGVEESVTDPARPFFLQRAAGQESPSRRPADHQVEPMGFGRIEIATHSMADWLGEVPFGKTAFETSTSDPSSLKSVDILVSDGPLITLTSAEPLGPLRP
jgi:hypothetical protein